MKDFLSWLAIAGGAIVLVAVCVAWWEHRRRAAAARRERAWPDTEAAYLDTQPLDLDVGLETGARASPPTGSLSAEGRDQAARRAVLEETLSRMPKHKAEPAQRSFWADTQSLVSASPKKSARASAARKPTSSRQEP